MRPFNTMFTSATLVGAIAAIGLPAWSSTIELLSLGDSTTYGQGSDTGAPETNGGPSTYGPFDSSADGNLGGYRFYLDLLLSSDYDFVGNRSQGTGISGGTSFTDNEHFGIRGGQASSDATLTIDGVTAFRPSTLTGIDNIATSPSSIDAAFNPTTGVRPDAVLLKIGINSLPGGLVEYPSDPNNLGTRLELTIQDAVSEFETLLKGDARTGLVDQMNDTNYFAADSHLFIALINPRTDGKDNSTLSRFVTKLQPNTVADYNSRVKDLVETEAVAGGELADLEGKYTFVDLYAIKITELDTQALADEFYGGNLGDLLAAINPEDEGDDNDLSNDYVDWTYNPDFDFDEGIFDNGEYDAGDLQLVEDARFDNINMALMPDGLHRSNLGAAINAQVWATAIENYYVPEPGSIALLAAGGMMLLGRRRRNQSKG